MKPLAEEREVDDLVRALSSENIRDTDELHFSFDQHTFNSPPDLKLSSV